MANGRYRQDPYAAFAQTIKPHTSGLGAAVSAFTSGPTAMDKKALALKEAQFYQTKRASDQAMAINQERFNQQKRVIASGDILSNLENDEFMTLGNLPTGVGDVFDENAFMESHYGVLGKKQEFMEKYRQRVDDKNKELGLNITPDLGKAEAMYNQFTSRESEKKLVDLMGIKQAKGMTAKEFNLYLRGVGNTHAGSNAVNFYLQNVDSNFKDSWAKQTGYVHGYETGWEDWNPFAGPGGERTGGAPVSSTGEKVAFRGGMALTGGLALEGVGFLKDWGTKEKAMKGVDDILKNKDIYKKGGKLLKANWKDSLTSAQKELLGGADNVDKIKGKAGLNKWAVEQKSNWNKIRPSQWVPKLGAKTGATEAARKAWAMTKGAKHKGIGPGALRTMGPYVAPGAGRAAGQAIGGDVGELAGGAAGLGAFLAARGPAVLRKLGTGALKRKAVGAAFGGPVGAGFSILLDLGFGGLEAYKLLKDYKEYQKTGKIGR